MIVIVVLMLCVVMCDIMVEFVRVENLWLLYFLEIISEKKCFLCR